MRCYSGFSANC
jgi:hypothetical protein